MANPVEWFEVSGPDAGGLQRFYAEAFRWEIDANNEMNYGMVAVPEGGIDTFVFRDGLIRVRTLRYTLQHKG